MTIRDCLPLGLILAGAACFQPTGPVTCLEQQTCECMAKSDCLGGKDCIDGRCAVIPPPPVPVEDHGKPCDGGADCRSGLCIGPGPSGLRVCTVGCSLTQPCPADWECKALPDGLRCAPRTTTLCLGCTRDSECNVAGDRCVDQRCARDCALAPCPPGYACTATDGGSPQCQPASGSCECSASNAGLERGCARSSDAGTCFGAEVCQGTGAWASCNARPPAAEVCNGVDDDCDGLTDGVDPSLDTTGLAGFPRCTTGDAGVCTGVWACADAGWACTARTPLPEQCNGLDDDCNGRADETFLDPQQRYVDVHHCGGCGFDCAQAVPFAADGGTVCVLLASAPACVPTRCAPGYFGFPESQPRGCRPLLDSSCRACVSDGDCTTSWDRCVTLGADLAASCLQSCEPGSPYGCTGAVGTRDCCPLGQLCTALAGTRLCSPSAATCACSPERLNATRPCFVGAAPQSCLGLQTCEAGSAWSSCSTAVSSAELCDGLDNDCDNAVDEDFIGTRGSSTYDTAAHCGSCINNCLARWSPTLQHAIGGCDAGPGLTPACVIAQCTAEDVATGADCRADSECAAGLGCDRRFHTCARACGTDADCPGGRCLAGRCAPSCSAGTPCAAPALCGDAGVCVRRWQFKDPDRDPTNGCECPAGGGADLPETFSEYPPAGMAYLDRDCDGVDGQAASSLFVRANSPASLGTRASPFRTIGEAIAAFNSSQHTAILVATGSYLERLALRSGVKLYGGYSADFTSRDLVAYSTIIEGPEPAFDTPGHRPGTVYAANLTQPTVFSGFTVRGYDVTFRPSPGSAGKSSYAIYVTGSSSALSISNNRVVGGRGGEGSTGTPGSAGANGLPGAPGRDSRECASADCAAELQLGGAAGQNAGCPASGGIPGAGSSPNASPQDYQPPLGLKGQGGVNNQYGGSVDGGTDGGCKVMCLVAGDSNGRPAGNGPDGIAPAPGLGCSGAGAVVGGEWVAGAATDGASGTAAVGGGGGGAGGWARNGTFCPGRVKVGDLGATGGGGGAGGCAGAGGRRGGSGGGSFGIFVIGAAGQLPTLEGNLIEPGFGGAGGNGGPGGYGGVGAQGGEAGVLTRAAWCAGSAGRGGRGGSGGAGSGAGGSCGGAAYGLAGTNLAAAGYAAKNRFGPVPVKAGGAPGAGGSSPAPLAGGLPGLAGASGTWSSF